MAQTPLPPIDDEKEYAVALVRPIKVGRRTIRPGAVRLKGKHVKANAEAVGNVKPAA